MDNPVEKPRVTQNRATSTKVRWDETNMKRSYANVCNVTFTREEIVFLFGINQAWQSNQKEVTIQLSDRVILSPFAAKRLALLLNGVLKEYENRFGDLNITLQNQSQPSSVKQKQT